MIPTLSYPSGQVAGGGRGEADVPTASPPSFQVTYVSGHRLLRERYESSVSASIRVDELRHDGAHAFMVCDG